MTAVDLQGAAGADVATLEPDGGTQRWHARFLVDASGRDTLLANKLQIKRRNPRHASAALYGHFTGARRLAGQAEGNISMFWFSTAGSGSSRCSTGPPAWARYAGRIT